MYSVCIDIVFFMLGIAICLSLALSDVVHAPGKRQHKSDESVSYI